MSIIVQFVSGRAPNIFRYAEGIIFNALSVGFREDHLSGTEINLQSRYQTLVWRVLHDCRYVSSTPFCNLIQACFWSWVRLEKQLRLWVG